MELSLHKHIIAFVLSFPISFAYANNNLSRQADILCPSLDKVQASVIKLDTAAKFNGKYYIAYTASSFFQENNIWWFAGVGNIAATSDSEALTLGKEMLKKINIQIDTYPTKVGNEFICNYAPGYVQARGKNIA